MNGNRIEAFTAAVKACSRVRKDGRLVASMPDESEEAAAARLSAAGKTGGSAIMALRALDAMMPFERDPGQGVWETLALDSVGGRSWICVVNATGEREHVTTWGCHAAGAIAVEAWAECREKSVPGDTEWDAARLERRTVFQGGETEAIDRGVNLMLDRLAEADCVTRYSCEGHPWGAYVVFGGKGAPAAAEAFEAIGWEVERRDGFVARMPAVSTVEERDAQWRRFSKEFRPEPFPGPDAPAMR